MFGIVQALTSNKLYLENNLLPLQIHYRNRDKILSKLNRTDKCIMQKLWLDYEKLIESDKFLMLKVGEDSYKMFAYEVANDQQYRVSLDDDRVGIYDISEFAGKNTIRVYKRDAFLGVYKPLSPLVCSEMRVTNVGLTVNYDEDRANSLINIWMEVERLKLSVETFLESLEIEHILKI